MDDLYKKICDYFDSAPRKQNIVIRTGVGGADMFQEVMEETMGFKRIYFPRNKVPRIISRFTIVKKSLRNKYYKLIWI